EDVVDVSFDVDSTEILKRFGAVAARMHGVELAAEVGVHDVAHICIGDDASIDGDVGQFGRAALPPENRQVLQADVRGNQARTQANYQYSGRNEQEETGTLVHLIVPGQYTRLHAPEFRPSSPQ